MPLGTRTGARRAATRTAVAVGVQFGSSVSPQPAPSRRRARRRRCAVVCRASVRRSSQPEPRHQGDREAEPARPRVERAERDEHDGDQRPATQMIQHRELGREPRREERERPSATAGAARRPQRDERERGADDRDDEIPGRAGHGTTVAGSGSDRLPRNDGARALRHSSGNFRPPPPIATPEDVRCSGSRGSTPPSSSLETPSAHMQVMGVAVVDPTTCAARVLVRARPRAARVAAAPRPAVPAPARRGAARAARAALDRGPRLRPRLPPAPRRAAGAGWRDGARRVRRRRRQPAARPHATRCGRRGSSRASSTATTRSSRRCTTR